MQTDEPAGKPDSPLRQRDFSSSEFPTHGRDSPEKFLYFRQSISVIAGFAEIQVDSSDVGYYPFSVTRDLSGLRLDASVEGVDSIDARDPPMPSGPHTNIFPMPILTSGHIFCTISSSSEDRYGEPFRRGGAGGGRLYVAMTPPS